MQIGFTGCIQDADIEAPGVKIDAAEIAMGFGIESHMSLLFRHCATGAQWDGRLCLPSPQREEAQ